jgi:hypothetical protein
LKKKSIRELEDFQWLLQNPKFREKPVTVQTFIDSPLYLNLKGKCRPRIYQILTDIFSGNYSEGVVAGAIGTGKTFTSSVAITYMVYKLGCLKNPQAYFGLSPDDGIFVMFMSSNEQNARNIIFSAVKARIDNSEWFRNRFPYDPKVLSELRFPNKVFIIPGNSSETFFEGYNIYGGVLDEADSHLRTPEKDFAEEGYYAIKGRIRSRFGDRGLLMVIGSFKSVYGFLMKRIEQAKNEPRTYTTVVPYWESPNPATHQYSGEKFIFRGLEIPIEHKVDFDRDPERSLRDIAAVPSQAVEPFFAFPNRIEENANTERENPTVDDKQFKDWFKAPDDDPRVIHIDLGINKKRGDACGLSMGTITGFKESGGEYLPQIKIDLIMRITSPPGGEVLISDVRQYIYELQRRNFNIKKVTFDGFQSTESIQELNRRKINAELLSVDRDTKAYESLKEAIYQERLDYYPHRYFIDEAKALELVNGEKVDHQPNRSKDVSDSVAGVVYNLTLKPPKIYQKIPKALFGLPRRTYDMLKEKW